MANDSFYIVPGTLVISPNDMGEPNMIAISTAGRCTITVYKGGPTLPTTESNPVWNIEAYNLKLGDNALRYVYAKCSKKENRAYIALYPTQKSLLGETDDFYYVPIGTISAVVDNKREFTPDFGIDPGDKGGFLSQASEDLSNMFKLKKPDEHNSATWYIEVLRKFDRLPLGDKALLYDSDNSAIKIEGDAYATGGFSVMGAGPKTTGSGGVSAFTELLDVAWSKTAKVGSIVTWDGTHFVNSDGVTPALDAEIERATREDARLLNLINADSIRISAFSNSLAAEIARATNEENALKNALAAEITRATNADSSFSTALSAEVNRATSVESGLNSTLNSLLSKFNEYFSWDAANQSIKVNYNLYSVGGIAAMGAGPAVSGGGGGASLLSDLLDCGITNPSAMQALVYDGQKWRNGRINASMIDGLKVTTTWGDVTNKPNSLAGYGITDSIWTANNFNPTTKADTAHNHYILAVNDTRELKSMPNDYYYKFGGTTGLISEFKSTSALDLQSVISAPFTGLLTLTKWGDTSGGCMNQLAFLEDGRLATRYGIDKTWNSWRILWDSQNSNRADADWYCNQLIATTSIVTKTNLYCGTNGLGAGNGLSLYGSTEPNTYGIHFSQTGSFGKHGDVQGDWANYYCVAGAANRGHIFRCQGTNVASISNEGAATFDRLMVYGTSNASALPIYVANTRDGKPMIGFNWNTGGIFGIGTKDVYTPTNIRMSGVNNGLWTSTPIELYLGDTRKVWHSDNFNPNGLEQYTSGRDFPSGTLILTNVAFNNHFAFLLEIKSNTYSNLSPFTMTVQGYIYTEDAARVPWRVINQKGTALGYAPTNILALNLDGKLAFWFGSQGYWCGYTAKLINVTGAGYNENRVINIVNSVEPASSYKVNIDIDRGWHSGNANSSAFDWNARNLTAEWVNTKTLVMGSMTMQMGNELNMTNNSDLFIGYRNTAMVRFGVNKAAIDPIRGYMFANTFATYTGWSITETDGGLCICKDGAIIAKFTQQGLAINGGVAATN